MSTDVARGARAGWIEFSAVVLFAVAFFRIIEAIAYFEKSHKLNDLTGGYFSGHYWGWGVLKNLTSLSSSSSKAEWQADLTAVDSAWNQVETDFQAVQNAPSGDLDSAWNDFESAVKNVPNDSSVSDAVSSITQSADQLVSAAQTTASEVDCSGSAMTTTTSTTG